MNETPRPCEPWSVRASPLYSHQERRTPPGRHAQSEDHGPQDHAGQGVRKRIRHREPFHLPISRAGPGLLRRLHQARASTTRPGRRCTSACSPSPTWRAMSCSIAGTRSGNQAWRPCICKNGLRPVIFKLEKTDDGPGPSDGIRGTALQWSGIWVYQGLLRMAPTASAVPFTVSIEAMSSRGTHSNLSFSPLSMGSAPETSNRNG